jgi:hypothetical protein
MVLHGLACAGDPAAAAQQDSFGICSAAAFARCLPIGMTALALPASGEESHDYSLAHGEVGYPAADFFDDAGGLVS